MRSDRNASIAAFERGYDDAAAEANLSAMEANVRDGKSPQYRGHVIVDLDLESGEVFYGCGGKEISREQAKGYVRVSLAGSDTTHGESF